MRRRGDFMHLWGPAAAFVSAVVCSVTGSAADRGRTLGFAVTNWDTAIYESRFEDECPEGLTPSNEENWLRGLSQADRARFTSKGSGGYGNRPTRRGANGENVCHFPTSAVDPPLLEAEGKLSYGINLDGTQDGKATAKSCAHEKFQGVDGTPAVDNQMYRLLGCTYGWCHYGIVDINADGQRKANGLGLILIEVRNVDDLQNDDDVEVAFYRSIDRVAVDGSASPLPYGTYRIDTVNGVPRYGSVVKGKIVKGELITQPANVNLPFYGNYTFIEQRFRDLSLHLEIDPSGEHAKGTIAGYYDVEQLWDYIRGLSLTSTHQYSCPAVFTALKKLADGYPDASGQCTHISSAFLVKAVNGFIQHPTESKISEASRGKTSSNGGRVSAEN